MSSPRTCAARVDPLPQVRPYEPVPYTAEGLIDPFRPRTHRAWRAPAGARPATALSELSPT